MDWLIWVVCACSIALIDGQRINLNPFAAFTDQKYEPVADYSIQRGVFLQNMPTAQIFPIAGESINGVVGIPSLQTPFASSLQAQQNLFTLANQNIRQKPKNNRNNRGPNQNGGLREQNGNGQQNTRGVTLDLRGGGYRVEPQRARPYNSPTSGGNAGRGTPQRQNDGRNVASNSNRNAGQRQRGPNLKNPYYNGKHETPMSSISANVEFVNPQNVLPMHPRFYKQFLRQNPQVASLLRAVQKQQQSNRNTPGPINTFDISKQLASQQTRNRIPPSLLQSSSLANLPAGFQIQSGPQVTAQLSSQLGLSNPSASNIPTFEEIFNSDPQFYSEFSKTPEGKAMMNQMYQHFGPTANKPAQGSTRMPSQNGAASGNPFAPNFSDFNKYSSAAATGFLSGNPMAGGGQAANQFANVFSSNSATDGRLNKPTVVDFSVSQLYNQNQQQNVPVQNQPALQLQQPQQQQPHSLSQSFSSGQSFSNYGGRQQYVENAPSSPTPTPDPPKQTPQSLRHQFDQYSGQSFGGDAGSLLSGVSEYDPSSYQSSYQESPKVVDTSVASGTAAFGSNFSPVDPLANTENAQSPAHSYLSYPSETSNYKTSTQRYPSTALHEISPAEAAARRPSASSSSFTPQTAKPVKAPGYWTPEQLFAPQSTGLQNDSPLAYPSSPSTSSQHPQDEQTDGSERAPLHSSAGRYTWSQARPLEYSHEFSGALNAADEAVSAEVASTELPDASIYSTEASDEEFKASIRDLQKVWTRIPPRSSKEPTRATTFIYRSTNAPEVKKTTKDELRNHKTTPSYSFQYSPMEKSNSKSTTAWWTRKPDGSKYKVAAPQRESTSTSVATTKKTTTAEPSSTTVSTTTSTTTTESPPPTFEFFTTTSSTSVSTSTASHYIDTDTPICALHNNLTYCLQDPEYPKDAIKEAIEHNRHPLDHFLVDISTASNVVDDQSLHSVLENSAPLQSTSVSYSFEGKVISPNAGEMLNSTGCSSNVYYAKPLRALNTAGLWKVIVNVAFEDTGANYTQTVRIEECTHPPGYVATCGTHSISACLQQYKLYRLLAWESHRGFYIDAFLLPVACFCGSQDS